ncbi:MAG: beta-lactamase domain-containing protein [Parcubacteria group bacterium Gr01-1014_20]|nr:MAG: beta-lactamase domain-containing protein [Parcubacteria group bacterium Gr01-1014_20]
MKNLSWVIFLALVGLDLLVWQQIIFLDRSGSPKIYFLDVGQGDSTLVQFPTGVQILTDAGPSKKVTVELEKVLGETDRYIDLAVITHPQLDHFNGFNEILERYEVGAFIVNGRGVELREWENLIAKIKEKKIPVIILTAGDKIKNAQNKINILSPDQNFIQSGELNDTSLVTKIETGNLKILLTGDIGQNLEKYLVQKFGPALKADILKIPHHGSKYSSSDEFLKNVNPEIAVIEVGDNRYGHPTEETLARLGKTDILKVLRTDRDGTIKTVAEDSRLKFFSAQIDK